MQAIIDTFLEAYGEFTADLVMWLAREEKGNPSLDSFGDWLIGIAETGNESQKEIAKDLLSLIEDARKRKVDTYDIPIAEVGKINYSLGELRDQVKDSVYYVFLSENFNKLLEEQQESEKEYLEWESKRSDYDKKYGLERSEHRSYSLPVKDHAIASICALQGDIYEKEHSEIDSSVVEPIRQRVFGIPVDFDEWMSCYVLNGYALASHYQENLLNESNQDSVDEMWDERTQPPFTDWLSSQLTRHSRHGWIVVEKYSNLEDAPPSVAYNFVYSVSASLEDYPLLDDEDHSRREMEATEENVEEAGGSLVSDDAPDTWVGDCIRWFWDNDQSAIEPRDGGGGYPSDDEMATCLHALGYLDEDEAKERGLLEE